MTTKSIKINKTFAEYTVKFLNDEKNYQEGDIKRSGSSFIIKKDGVVLMYVSNRIICRFTATDEGLEKEFMFYNGTAVKRIVAVLEELGLNTFGISSPRVGVVQMIKANGTAVNLKTRLPYSYDELVALHASDD